MKRNNDDMFREKMKEVQSILELLSMECDLKFSLNYFKQHEGSGKEEQNMIYSSGLSPDLIDSFQNNLRHYKAHIDMIPNLIRQGNMVVVCRDAENKPENIGDWLEKNRCYIVESVLITVGGKYAYKLRGMNVNDPYVGYSASRFQQVDIAEKQN